MDIDDTSAVLGALKKYSKSPDAWRRHTYSIVRGDQRGDEREVEVTITDHGAGVSPRFMVYAEDARVDHPAGRRRSASGNPDDSLELALAMVHWGELDRDHG